MPLPSSTITDLARVLEALDENMFTRRTRELFADDYRCTYYSRDGVPPIVTDRYGRKVPDDQI